MHELYSKLNKNIFAKTALIVLIATFIVVSIFVLSIKYLISYSYIEKKALEQTGLKIEFIEPETSFNYKLNLNTKAKAINVYSRDKKLLFLSAKNPNITFKPLGLAFGKANFKNISADDIKIILKRNSDGKLDIAQYLNKDFKFPNSGKIALTKLNLDIKNIVFLFDDNYKTKSQIKLNLKDTKINASKRKKLFLMSQKGTIETTLKNEKQIALLSLEAQSDYPFNKINNDKLNLNINLDNINLYVFSDLAKKYISKDIEALNGKVNISLKTTKKDEVIQNLSAKITKPQLKLINGKTITPYKEDVNIAALGQISKNKTDIKEGIVEADNLFVKFEGYIANLLSKKPDINLDIETKNTQINALIPFIPDNAIYYRPKGIPTLKNSNFHGILSGKINFKYLPLDITGNLKVQDVHIPTYPKSYRQNDVNIMFMRDKMRVYTRVYTPENEYVLIDGISNLDDSLYGKYSVKSTSKIDLSFAKLYLVPIQQIIGFNIGPVPIMNIKGYGNINIDTKGTINDAQIFGVFNAYNAQAELKGLNTKLSKGKCTLIFDNRDLIFKELKGNMEGADFSMGGKGDTKGRVSLDIKIKNAKTGKILKIFNNSNLSKPYTPLTKQIAAASGDMDADINLKGTIQNWENPDFLSTLSPSGNITVKNNKIILNNGFLIDKLSGILNFGQEQNAGLKFNIKNSMFKAELSSKDSLDKISKGENFSVETMIFSNKIALSDIIWELNQTKTLKESEKKLLSGIKDINFYSKLYLKSKGTLSINDIKPENFKHGGYLLGLNSSEFPNIKFKSGIVKINNNKITFDNFEINASQGKIKIRGNIDNILSKRPSGDLSVFLKNIKLDELNKIIPKIKTSSALIKNGEIIFKNNNVKFNSISMNYSGMPVFLNASIRDTYGAKLTNADFTTIINEQSADNIINPYLVSPLKINGEVPLRGIFHGNENNYLLNFKATIPENSDISFNGANLGDINHKRELEGKIGVEGNVANIHNLKLTKFIANQNNKINPITALKINGKIVQNNNSLLYDNLKITTNTPINVRILNLIFKKSLLKKGNFDCSINLSGDVKLPKINGKVNLYDLDIPLYDTKIDDIKINISNNTINSELIAKNKQSDLKVNIEAQNKLNPPYIIKNLDIVSNNLNIENILNSITPPQTKTDISPKTELAIKSDDIIIENGTFDIKDVHFEKINAKNMKGDLSYKNGIIKLNNILLNIAQGTIEASGKYDIKTTKLNIDASMDDCDSNALSKSFLNLSNQIYGKMDGTLSLSAKNLNTPQGINKVKSNITFSIDNGKMPKLGSMEYLLRAGNLFKNGILGLSLNNIIEVLTPYKTGEFEKISGNLFINNGEIETLNILSQGKNMSLFLDGNYNILENYADIKIYGKLSRNISNALGAIGNASISQFIETISRPKRSKNEKDEELQKKLNKIPQIEVESPKPVYFRAKVLGDINKDNYIKSFEWI